MLVPGYAIGIMLAGLFAGFSASTRRGADLLATLTAMFNPLPAIALLPLALLWSGLGTPSLLCALVHSVFWPLALNASAGFASVGETLRMAGRDYGLSGWRRVVLILIPAAFPAILTGLKIGWAFAWRTLIAAGLVFGVASGSGGLGWFIFQSKNQLETASVFAGLGTVIIVGLLVLGPSFNFVTLSGGSSTSDTLLSNSIDIATGGVGAFPPIWVKTRGTLEVRANAAISTLPILLVTTNPSVKSLADFTDKDRIALPSVKSSIQAGTLQMAAEAAFGAGNHRKLDDLTVSMRHPDGYPPSFMHGASGAAACEQSGSRLG